MPNSKSKIYTLKELIEVLNKNIGNISFADTFKRIQFGFKEIEHLCFWDSENYAKISIDQREYFDLVLICWEKGQKSPIHNHDIDEAWTSIVKGEITEEIYNSDNNPVLEDTLVLSKKKFSSFKKDSHKAHRLINSYDGRTVSLHLYTK